MLRWTVWASRSQKKTLRPICTVSAISVQWIKKNSDKKVQEQQGPRRTTKHNGLQKGAWRDLLPYQEVGQGPGPTPRCGKQGPEVYQQQDPLQPYGPRCAHIGQTGQGQKAELPVTVDRRYGPSCNYGHQGLPCRWEGQPTTGRYRKKGTGAFMATRSGVGELRCGHGLEQRGELCISGSEGTEKFHPAPRDL